MQNNSVMGTVIRTSKAVVILTICALLLAGCGRINTSLSHSIADSWPVWAGGLPKNAPPRPGNPRYAQFIRKQMSKALVGKKLARTMAMRPFEK
jgi:hypothetical protein